MGRGKPYHRDRGGRGGFRGGPSRGPQRDGGAPSSGPEDTLATVLRLTFEKRSADVFDPSTSMLNLSSLRECADLSDMRQSVDFNSGAFCRAVVAAVKAKFGVPRFVNVNANHMRSLHHFAKALIDEGLADSIGGISAANNEIREAKELVMLKRFPNLQELVLVHNPICHIRDYPKQIAKVLPSLLGLDCEAIERPPLSLPNPISPGHDPNPLQLLQLLHAQHFEALATHQADIVANLYHPEAVLSITTDGKFSIAVRTFSKDKRVMNDLASFQRQMRERVRRGASDSRHLYRGRGKVMTELVNALYPRNFATSYTLSPTASVSLVGALPVPLAVVTLHGTLGWAHVEVPNEVQKCHFDRTLVLIYDDTARSWQVTNDALHLRHEANDVVMTPSSPDRIKRLSNATRLPEDVVQAIVSLTASDLDFMRMAATVQEDVYGECLALCTGNVINAVRCCNIAAQRQIAPAAAFAAAQSANFAIDR